MSCGLFMLMLNSTVLNVALPSIQRSLDVPTSALEWTINAYTLTFAVLLVAGGRLADVVGRRRCFLLGIGLFAAASCAIACAPDDAWLIAWRAVQGAAAALMMPPMLPIISSAFVPGERGKAIGMWSGVSGTALLIGPVVGGLVVQTVGWRAIFLLNLPVAAAAVALTLQTTPESRDRTVQRRLDVPGALALALALVTAMLALIQGDAWRWGSPRELSLLATAAVALVAFVRIERRSRVPMVDFACFRSRSFLGANLVGLTAAFSMVSMYFFLALYMQDVAGYSPLKAGLCFLPATVTVTAAGPVAGRLTDVVGPRRLMSWGLLVVAGSLVWLSRVGVEGSLTLLLGAFALMGVGLGFVTSPTSTAAMNAIEASKGGVASGVLSTTRTLGGAFGLAALGALIQARTGGAQMSGGATTAVREAFVHALHDGLLLDAGVALLGVALAALLVAGRPAKAESAVELVRSPLLGPAETARR